MEFTVLLQKRAHGGFVMLELWKASLEYKVWGWNFPTSVVAISFVYLFFELWALWKQNKLIWLERSGETVSIIWFSYYGIHAFAGIMYGIQIQSIAVMSTSLMLGLIHIPIVIGLWKFKAAEGTLRRHEKVQVALFPLMLPAVIFLPYIDLVYSLFTLGIMYGLVIQPYEMWRTRSRGVLEVRVIFIYLGSSLIWTSIGFYLHIPLFMLFSPLSTLCLVAMLILWFRFAKEEKKSRVYA